MALLFGIHRLRKQRDTLLREKDIAYSFLHDVGDVFGGTRSVDVDSLVERVLFYAQRATKAEAGVVYLLDDDELLSAKAISGMFPPLVEGVTGLLCGSEGKVAAAKKITKKNAFTLSLK